MKKKLCAVVAVLTLALFFANTTVTHADDKQVKGEIVGVLAKAPLEELTGGNKLKNLQYGGKLIVLLSDGEKVKATCNADFLSNVKGCPTFTTKKLGGMVATISLIIEKQQKVLLVRNQANEWKVTKVLK